MPYHLLDDLPDTQPLVPRPVQVWILLTMEIVLRTRSGHFLIAKQPYYADAGDPDALFEGAWAPPFIGVPVPQRYDVAATPRVLEQRFSEAESAIRSIELIEQFLYEMGVENPSILERVPFTEIKSSPRNPSVVKAYKIRRFSIQSELSTSKSNLADPDGRKGFVYIPLDELDRYVQKSPPAEAGPKWSYLGLPLMTNLATVLTWPSEVNRMRSSAINVEPDFFFHDQHGIIIVLDLSGYGRAVRYVTENMNSLDATGKELAEFFRTSLAAWFAEMLAAIGARQIQHAGDGFLCALNSADSDRLVTLGEELRRLQERIDKISENLPLEYKLGTRVAIHRGRYRYGRVGGALSVVPGFDGETIVTAARMEQALGNLIRSQSTAIAGRHLAVTSLDAASEEALFGNADWSATASEISLKSKEFATDAHIWARPRDDALAD